MKYFFDNNLSPYLAKSIAALCEVEKVKVVHLRDKFDRTVPDEKWIEELSQEKEWVIISHDRFAKNHEKEALRKSGLIVFTLAKGWGNITYWEQAWSLTRWWPRIMEQANGVKGGAVFLVPKQFSGKGKFEQPLL